MRWFRRIWEAAKAANDTYGLLTSDFAKVLVYPLGSAVLTLLSGFFNSVPAPYVLASAGVMFAGVATGMLRLDEWRARTNPSGRLAFDQPILGINMEVKGDQPVLMNVQIGIILRNTADFVIHYEVEDVDTQFMGRVATDKTYTSKGGEVTPNTIAVFRDPWIPIECAVPDAAQLGRIKFRVSYWRNPKKKYYIDRDIRINVKFNVEKEKADFDWYYQ